MRCKLQGFPYGTKPGEEERVSLPNAKFTQGHYKVGTGTCNLACLWHVTIRHR